MKITKYYWFWPLILFFVQAVYTFSSLTQIRYEELAESVRNPFWFQYGYMYDGTSGSIAWYGLLVFIYNTFGFSLFTAKFVRLFLQLISLFCLAALLKKYLGKWAIIPLFALGLSPTLLYFNTLQATYGMDLQYLPILLFLFNLIHFEKGFFDFFKQSMFWIAAMIIWLSYPTYVFYLPSIVILYTYRLIRQKNYSRAFIIKNIFTSLVSFLIPLIFTFIYIRNKQSLIFDSITHSGLFRGAGLLKFDLGLFTKNLGILFNNLFNQGLGYNYELNSAEFSNFYPILTIILLGYLIIKAVCSKERIYILLTLLVLFLNVFIVGFTIDPLPGMRRLTPSIAALYILFVFCWKYVLSEKRKISQKFIYIAILCLIPLHHILVFPINLSHLKDPSYFKEMVWFAHEDPQRSLKTAVGEVQKHDLELICEDQENKPFPCRYSEIYAAVAGSCLWNHLVCHKIKAYDFKTKSFITLSTDVWNNYYFNH